MPEQNLVSGGGGGEVRSTTTQGAHFYFPMKEYVSKPNLFSVKKNLITDEHWRRFDGGQLPKGESYLKCAKLELLTKPPVSTGGRWRW